MCDTASFIYMPLLGYADGDFEALRTMMLHEHAVFGLSDGGAHCGLICDGVIGDLVWDDRQQEGYMRFKGLAPNDPDVYQYQLWIFDATRDERHPVDGGVFDVPSGSDEVIVPIRAKLPVGEPVLFAITVEKPGGVVVSDRERIALVAKPNQEI